MIDQKGTYSMTKLRYYEIASIQFAHNSLWTEPTLSMDREPNRIPITPLFGWPKIFSLIHPPPN